MDIKFTFSFRNVLFRILCLLGLFVIIVLEIAPIPISSLLLVWMVLFRPQWFYTVIQKIYNIGRNLVKKPIS